MYNNIMFLPGVGVMRVSLMSVDGQKSEMGTGVRPDAERRYVRSVHRRRPLRGRKHDTATGRTATAAGRAAAAAAAVAAQGQATETAPPPPATATEAGRVATAPQQQQ